MHSSGMRTARLLTVSEHALHNGVSAQGGVCPGGRGMSAQGMAAWGVADTPRPEADTPPREQTGVKTLPCCNFVAGGNSS